jgi:hypothetical protein
MSKHIKIAALLVGLLPSTVMPYNLTFEHAKGAAQVLVALKLMKLTKDFGTVAIFTSGSIVTPSKEVGVSVKWLKQASDYAFIFSILSIAGSTTGAYFCGKWALQNFGYKIPKSPVIDGINSLFKKTKK